MTHLTRPVRLGLATIAAGMLLTNGCQLQHGPRPPFSFSTVSPQSYCPGDLITASYDLTQETACVSRPGFDCAAVAWPAITIDSSPISFPPQTFTASSRSLNFTSTEPRIDVTFTPPGSSASYLYPSVDTAGTASFTARNIRTQTLPVERIDGSISRERSHDGMCNDGTPTYASAVIANLPELSPNLRVQEVCNASAVPIIATLSSASGDVSRELSPGACFVPNEPGAPAVPATGSTISVRSLVVDPIAQCNPVQGMTPPTQLTTRAVLACGN